MSSPSPSPAATDTPKASFAKSIFWNILMTAAVFFLVPFVFYGPPVFGTTAEIVQTLLMAIAYAFLYTRASVNWRVDPNTGFLNSPGMISAAASSKIPWLRIGNSLLFSLLSFVLILMALYLAGFIVVNLYGFIFEGVRGAMPPLDASGSETTLIQLGMSGLGMELIGKTEDSPRPTTP